MTEGKAQESMCKRMLSTVPEEGMDIIEQAYAASAPFAAGVETVSLCIPWVTSIEIIFPLLPR